VVVSNRKDAYALERAREAGVPTQWIPHRGRSRDEFEQELVACLETHKVEWVALAGFMRVLGAGFLAHWPRRVLNIHPSLLPAFPGLHVHEQTLAAGVRISGATVHLVDEGMDTGPIVAQASVPVLPDDDVERLKARILRLEHRLYPAVLKWAVEDRIHIGAQGVQIDLSPGESLLLWDNQP
jgi:phosphoribosylglycinamide formyltransferase-1